MFKNHQSLKNEKLSNLTNTWKTKRVNLEWFLSGEDKSDKYSSGSMGILTPNEVSGWVTVSIHFNA